jgi:glycosyltransferase involved in cell wall biosynthesis
MLFDPFNIHDMAAKMEWAVLNRQALIDLQKPLYEKFAKRSWEVVANEYTALFDKIGAENDKIS